MYIMEWLKRVKAWIPKVGKARLVLIVLGAVLAFFIISDTVKAVASIIHKPAEIFYTERVDTVLVESPRMAQELQSLRDEHKKALENLSGLRGVINRLRGRSSPQAETLYVAVDSLYKIKPQNLIYELVTVDSDGIASGTILNDPDSIGYTPNIFAGMDLSKCDDALSIGPSGILCDRPRLGHFTPILSLSYQIPLQDFESRQFEFNRDRLNPGVGLSWKPYHRSWFRASVLYYPVNSFLGVQFLGWF